MIVNGTGITINDCNDHICVEIYFCKVPDSDCFVQQLVKNLDIFVH